MAFNVTVDEYSVLSITGAYSYVVRADSNKNYFVFQIGNATTYVPSV
jgi:hypothetical protein